MYPFQYQLPADLPSSFVGKYGGVCYGFRCFIKRPGMSDHIACWLVDVRGQLDLNQVPDVLVNTLFLYHHNTKNLLIQSRPFRDRLLDLRIS